MSLEEDRPVMVADAQPPFDDPDADVILRSVDQVDFRVFKCLLSLSSPFFKSMFALPQPPDSVSASNDETRDGLPVIPIDELSRTVCMLLESCHPGCAPVLAKLEDIQEVLRVATKFDMQAVAKRVANLLTAPNIIQAEPVRVFSIACRFGFEAQAKLAAKETLRFPLAERMYVEELEHISAGAYHYLLEYFFNCSKAAQSATTDFDWMKRSDYYWFICGTCTGSPKNVYLTNSTWRIPRLWWTEYMRKAGVALSKSPHHQTILQAEWMFTDLKASGCNSCRASAGELVGFAKELSEEILRRTLQVPG